MYVRVHVFIIKEHLVLVVKPHLLSYNLFFQWRTFPPLTWFRFSAFADLFSEATRRGLKSLQIQNPGLYFHNAALYAIERKQYAQRLCLEAAKVLTLSQAASELRAGDQTVYFGQRPWRRGLPGGCGYRFDTCIQGTCPLV